jgi:hypothetical protein
MVKHYDDHMPLHKQICAITKLLAGENSPRVKAQIDHSRPSEHNMPDLWTLQQADAPPVSLLMDCPVVLPLNMSSLAGGA